MKLHFPIQYLEPYKDKIDFDQITSILQERNHWLDRKDSAVFKKALSKISEFKSSSNDYSSDAVILGKPSDITDSMRIELIRVMNAFIPWRKGPFQLFGEELDSEWRSDFKWNRVKEKAGPLTGKRILDIGCNNGYFLFRMLEQNPELAMGVDPMHRLKYQFEFLKYLSQDPRPQMEMLGWEHVSLFNSFFDVAFCMGIIYHHPDPLHVLKNTLSCLKPGGTAIIETLGIPGMEPVSLFVPDRYMNIRNTFFIPTESCFKNWMIRAGFSDVTVFYNEVLSVNEQRTTHFCPVPSLADFLDPQNQELTMEGFPRQRRMIASGIRK